MKISKIDKYKKNLNVAATYIPTSVACSIIGDERLNFQVRNGAGCDPLSNPTTKRKKNTAVCFFLSGIEKRNLILLRA